MDLLRALGTRLHLLLLTLFLLINWLPLIIMFDFHLWIEGLVKQHLMRRLIFEISLILDRVIFILIEDLIVNQLDMVLLISLLISWTFFIFVKKKHWTEEFL